MRNIFSFRKCTEKKGLRSSDLENKEEECISLKEVDPTTLIWKDAVFSVFCVNSHTLDKNLSICICSFLGSYISKCFIFNLTMLVCKLLICYIFLPICNLCDSRNNFHIYNIYHVTMSPMNVTDLMCFALATLWAEGALKSRLLATLPLQMALKGVLADVWPSTSFTWKHSTSSGSRAFSFTTLWMSFWFSCVNHKIGRRSQSCYNFTTCHGPTSPGLCISITGVFWNRKHQKVVNICSNILHGSNVVYLAIHHNCNAPFPMLVTYNSQILCPICRQCCPTSKLIWNGSILFLVSHSGF